MFDLTKKCEAIAEDNIGMPSVFAIASQLKEDAEAVVEAKIHKLEKEREEEMLKQEAEERKKFEGTKVTPESFEKWRKAFRKEFDLDNLLLNKYVVLDKNGQPKMTGRQMFEKGLMGDIDEDDGGDDIEPEDDEKLASGVNKLSVS